jgi:CIC family chloride channel protein
LALAGCVGLIGGGINLIFTFLADGFGTWAWSFPDTSESIPSSVSIVLLTVLGGLLAGLVLHFGLHYIGRQGSTNFLEAVLVGDGRLPFRTAVVKGVSSLISIVSGASIGREGSITQLTATMASKWGHLLKWPPYRLRLLVACGAASGMAAAYNAPIAGAVFAAQVVLGNFAMNLFAPLVFASVIATMMSRSFLGQAPLYDVPSIEFTNDQLVWFLLLGVLCGLMAALFQKALRSSERWLGNIPMPIYLRLALGGLIVGLLAVSFPGVIGNGYQEASDVLHGDVGVGQLFGLTFARFFATVIVVGVGTLGGIFTPTLFLGAGLGGLYYYGLEWCFDSPLLPIGAYALVGMGGMLAGTTHAPLLAMIMIFELTLNYSLMPPLMLTCVVATLIARSLHRANVYSEGLDLKGLATSWETERIGAATRRRIGDLMMAPTPPLRDVDSFETMTERFIKSTYYYLPVVDGEERLKGIVALQDLKEYLTMGDHLTSVIAMDVMRPPPQVLTPNQRLDEAMSILLSSDMRNVPVVNRLSEMKFIGVVVRSEALGLLSEAIASKIPAAGAQSE